MGSRMGGLAVKGGKTLRDVMSLTCNDDSLQILQQLWSKRC